MPVELTENGRPIGFGKRVAGKDIPTPPKPPKEYRWDSSTGEWVHDPPADSTPDVSSMTDTEIAAALRDESLSASEALAQMVENGRI